MSSTAFSGYFEPVRNGVIYPIAGLSGKPFTTMAPATRFNRWKQKSIFDQINASLNELDRLWQDRRALSLTVCVDSQLVKLLPVILEKRGLDTYKRVDGRLRQLLVDTQGRLWLALVHSANGADGPSSPRPDWRRIVAGW